MWYKGISKEVNIRDINGMICVMVLECFTIKMEGCMKDSGGLTVCKERVNCIINLENLLMKEIGSTISLRE